MHKIIFVITLVLLYLGPANAQFTPAEIYTDPISDQAHPAAMEMIYFPTHGVSINGVLYRPSGKGLIRKS